MTIRFVGGAAFFTFLFVFGSLASARVVARWTPIDLDENDAAFTGAMNSPDLNWNDVSPTIVPYNMTRLTDFTFVAKKTPCLASQFHSHDVIDRMFNAEFRESDPPKDIPMPETMLKSVEISHCQPFLSEETHRFSHFALTFHSDVFDRMFNSDFRESDPHTDISLPGKQHIGFKTCLPLASTVRHTKLYYLEAIHNFVEVFIEYLHNVCKLDLVFNFYKVLVALFVCQRRGGLLCLLLLLPYQTDAFCVCDTDERVALCQGIVERKLLLCEFDVLKLYRPASCFVPAYLVKGAKIEFINSTCKDISIKQAAGHPQTLATQSPQSLATQSPQSLATQSPQTSAIGDLQTSAALSDLQTSAAFRSTESTTPSSQPIEASPQLSTALKVVLAVFAAFLLIVCALCGCILYLMRAEVKKRNAKRAMELENGDALDNIVLDTEDWQNHQRRLEERLAELRRLSDPHSPTAPATPLASDWQLVSDAAASLVASTASAKPRASSAKPRASSATAKPSTSTKSAKPIAPFHMQLRTADERCACLACTLPNCCPHPFTYADFNLQHK